jgi:hypothetical protein
VTTYETPDIVDYGLIAEHTFTTPGKGTKSGNTTYELDKFGEFSHPGTS